MTDSRNAASNLHSEFPLFVGIHKPDKSHNAAACLCGDRLACQAFILESPLGNHLFGRTMVSALHYEPLRPTQVFP